MADSPELVAAKRLLDVAKNDGFAFERIAPGEDGPLRGVRETPQWRDVIYLAGLWAPNSCSATRRRRCSLVVPGGLPIAERGCPDRPAHGAIRLDHLTPTTGQAASSHRPRSATGTVTTSAGNHRADRGEVSHHFSSASSPTDQHQHHPGKRRHAPPAPPETPRTALGTPPADSFPLWQHHAHPLLSEPRRAG